MIAMCNAQGGAWVSTIYKVEERINSLNTELMEVEDQQRLVMNQIDDFVMDLKNAITKQEKLTIGRKITHLRSKLVVLYRKKNTLVNAIRTSVNKVPKRLRQQVIRDLKIENRFNSIREVVDDVEDILHPATTVSHKASTKATIKRMGHGLAKKLKL